MSRARYKHGEKVMVPHTDKHYPAKVLKSELYPDGVRHYFLHYLGWNKKWDEWVTEDEIEPCVSMKVSLPKKRDPTECPKSAPPHLRKQLKQDSEEKSFEVTKSTKKRKSDALDKEAHLQIRIEIPAILKKQLLDEHDLVINARKTASLPRKPNATQILHQFYDYGKKELRCTNSELQMLITGLEEYMDKTLEDFLLYEIEWAQSARLLSGGISASSVYGAEHLLRLLVKLQELVPPTSVTAQQAMSLNARLHDFLDYLVINRHAFFANVKEYAAAGIL